MILKPWMSFALLNTFLTSLGLINYKYLTLFSQNISIILAQGFVLTGVVALLYLLYNRKKVIELNTQNDTSKLVLHMGLFAVFLILTRYLFLKSLRTAPNAGYTHMIVNLNVLVTFILSYLLFKQTINIKTFGGIILCLAGLYIIINYS